MFKYRSRIWAGRKAKRAMIYYLIAVIFIIPLVAFTYTVWQYTTATIRGHIVSASFSIGKFYLYGEWNKAHAKMMIPLALIGIVLCCKVISDCVKVAIQYHLIESAATTPVSTDHGDTIAEFIYRTRKEIVEYNASFDGDGTKISETTRFHPKETKLSESCRNHLQQYPEHKHVHIHNHPLSATAFSDNDIAVFIAQRFAKSIVIADSMIYTLEAPESLQRPEWEVAKKEYNDLFDRFQALSSCSFPLSSGLPNEKTAVCTILTCQCLAARYGFTFTCEKYKKSQYYRDYCTLRRQRTLNRNLFPIVCKR